MIPGSLNALMMQQVVSGFSVSDLFANSEDGGWYDPSDLSTMWKDTAGTIAVTADGDLVARIDDKSGNGSHLTQSTSANRPAYKTAGGLHWLEFDGSNDFLAESSLSANIVEGGGSMAVSATSDKTEGFGGLIEEVDTVVSDRRVVIFFDTRATPTRLTAYAPDGTFRGADLDAEIDGTAKTFIFVSDGSTGTSYLNNTAQTATVTTTANFTSTTKLELGRQLAGGYHDGKIYGAIVLDRAFTASERPSVNTYLSSKAGI